MIKFLTPGWQKVLQPLFTKPYCLPFKPNNVALDPDAYTENVFRVSREAFYQSFVVQGERVNCPPWFFLFKEEQNSIKNFHILLDRDNVLRERNRNKHARSL